MTGNSDDLTPPKRTAGDLAHAAVKAVLSEIPLGGTAAEVFQWAITPPFEKRLDAWRATVAETVVRLVREGVTISGIRDNPEFLTVVLHTTNIALRTHEEEKLKALCSAVENTARGLSPGETLRHLFLVFIDDLTPTHLRLLKAFQAPTAPTGLDMGGLIAVLEHALPELKGHRELSALLWRDLVDRGLIIKPDDLHMRMSQIEFRRKRTTNLGDQFLKFISIAGDR